MNNDSCCRSRDSKRGLMQWLGPFLIGGMALFSCSPQTSDEAKVDKETARTVSAVYSPEPLNIDGQHTESIYQESPLLVLKNSSTAEEVRDSAYLSYAQVLYDQDYLYIAFTCFDKDIHSSYTDRDQYLWNEEAVEVFIDVDDQPNDYVEIEVSPKNILYDSFIVDPYNIDIEATLAYNLKDIHHAVSVDGTVTERTDVDKKWTVEIAIPFQEILPNYQFDMLKEAQWKINFYRLNLDEYGARAFAWSPTQGSFHQPDKFGELVFD